MFPSTHPRPTQKYMPPQTGKKIKNYIYEYGDLIGKGNFAKVYKGHNLNTQQTLAIKLISLDELKCKHLESLVFEEIKILQMMNHPNVLNFFEALLSQRNCYIVTELCNQGSLDDRLKSKIPLSQTELGSIIFDIFNGLQYLRDKGVTHRDLKPANIFINNDRMKIADFGLAKLFKQRFHDLDIGSPQYMSPQGLILNNYSQKTDIWSFGIIIYEILHGAAPFINCRSQQELIYNITRPIPQNRWKKDINPLLRQMLNKLLEIDEFKRPNILQLAEQPYMRMLIELDREKKVQKQLTHSLSFCGFMALNKNEQGSNQGDRRDFCQFSSRNTKQKAENQQPQSTKGSQNSICKKRFSVGDTPNTEIDYLIPLDQSTQNRFSFSKMSHQSNELQHLQKSTNAHSNRLQIPEKCAYSEGQASNNRNSALMSHSAQKHSLTQNLKTSTLIRLQPMRQQKHTSPFVSRQLFYN